MNAFLNFPHSMSLAVQSTWQTFVCFAAASPALAATQLFTDIQTGQSIIAIPILAPNVRFFSTKEIRPALKLEASLDGGGGGKSPTKNGGGGGKATDGNGKQASGGDNGNGDDKLVSRF